MPNQSCPSCGNENPPRAGFCMSCGTALSQSQPWTQSQHQQVQHLRHSPLGIASFVLSIVGVVPFIMIAGTSWDDGLEVLLWFIWPFLVVAFVGLVAALALGIVGLFQKQRNGLFAVLGTVFSAVGWLLLVVRLEW